MSENIKDSNKRTSLKPFLILAAGVFALWLIAWLFIVGVLSDWPSRGQFGDMFGAINSLFSGLAFAGVIFTIYLQREELALQRNELELTRTQLARSADAQEKSEEALKQQVDVLSQTARLNALSSIIEHYAIKIKHTNVASRKLEIEKRQLDYIEQLEQEMKSVFEE